MAQLPPRLGTLKQAAEIPQCSVDTIRRRIRTGELIGYKIGRQILRVDLDEVERLFSTVGNDAS